MADPVTSKKSVEYVPPTPDMIDAVARNVCRKLADSDPSFNEPDVVYGFAAFLSAVAKMHANHLNKRTDLMSLDTDA
jgi:hypothetical protein